MSAMPEWFDANGIAHPRAANFALNGDYIPPAARHTASRGCDIMLNDLRDVLLADTETHKRPDIPDMVTTIDSIFAEIIAKKKAAAKTQQEISGKVGMQRLYTKEELRSLSISYYDEIQRRRQDLASQPGHSDSPADSSSSSGDSGGSRARPAARPGAVTSSRVSSSLLEGLIAHLDSLKLRLKSTTAATHAQAVASVRERLPIDEDHGRKSTLLKMLRNHAEARGSRIGIEFGDGKPVDVFLLFPEGSPFVA